MPMGRLTGTLSSPFGNFLSGCKPDPGELLLDACSLVLELSSTTYDHRVAPLLSMPSNGNADRTAAISSLHPHSHRHSFSPPRPIKSTPFIFYSPALPTINPPRPTCTFHGLNHFYTYCWLSCWLNKKDVELIIYIIFI